jgi:outer membrane protein assembly factor BamB
MNTVKPDQKPLRSARRIHVKIKMIAGLITVLLISSMASNVNASSPVNFVQTWTFPIADGFNVGDMASAQGVVAIEQSQFGPPAIDNVTSYGLDGGTGKLLWSTQDFELVANAFGGGATNFASSGQTNKKLFFAINPHTSFGDCSVPYKYLAIEPRTGHVLWSVDAPCHSSGPFVAGDTVVVYRYNEALATYDASTGNLKWLLPEKGVPYFGTPVAYGSGILLLRGLIALNVSSGAQIWTRPIPLDSFDCSSVVNETVFGEDFNVNYTSAGSITGLSTISVIALDGKDGSTLWNKTYPYVNSHGSGCPAVQSGRIFFMSYPVSDATAQIIALRTTDGSEQWRRTLPCMNGCSIYLNGAAAGDGLLFVSNGLQYTDTEYNDTMYAFDTISGSTMWQHTFPNSSFARMIYGDGTLYASVERQIAGFSKQGIAAAEFPSTLALVTFAIAVLSVRLMTKRREEG